MFLSGLDYIYNIALRDLLNEDSDCIWLSYINCGIIYLGLCIYIIFSNLEGNNMDGFLILNKAVDKSVLTDGFSIPIQFHEIFFQQLGFTLDHGESRDITLLLDNVEYVVTFINQGFNREKFGNRTDILQIRYTAGNPLVKKLREKYAATQRIVEEYLTTRTDKKRRLVIPEDNREYLAIYATPIRGTLMLDCITATEYREAVTEIHHLDEWSAETATDPDASIVTTVGARKVRRLSRAVGDGLKLLYDYRCQICGQKIGEAYGSNLIHAHHIDYFVKSLNNDASNVLVVCPNHHAVIHDRNPEFDRKKLVYHYPNGLIEGLALNKHLTVK